MNVHPTKREVHFLDEEAIISSVCDAVQEALVKDSGSRTFKYQVSRCNLFLNGSKIWRMLIVFTCRAFFLVAFWKKEMRRRR